MKKIYQFLTLALLTTFFVGCTESIPNRENSPEYTGVNSLYFPKASVYEELNTQDNVTSYKIPVKRLKKSGKETFKLVLLSKTDDITADNLEVTFEDGEDEAYVTVGITAEYKGLQAISVSIPNEVVNPYLDEATEFKFSYVQMPFEAEKTLIFDSGIYTIVWGIPSVDYIFHAVKYKKATLPDGTIYYSVTKPFAEAESSKATGTTDEGKPSYPYVCYGGGGDVMFDVLKGSEPENMLITMKPGKNGESDTIWFDNFNMGVEYVSSSGTHYGANTLSGQKGVYDADAQTIVFPAGEVTLTLGSAGKNPSVDPLTFYLDMDKFKEAKGIEITW